MRITDVKERDIEVRMHHDWPVRDPRPVRERLSSHRPLNIGQRVIDVFFPVLIGGTAAIPGRLCVQVCFWMDLDKLSFLVL